MFENIIRQMRWLLIEQTKGIYISDFFIILVLSAFIVVIPGYVLYIKKAIPYRKIVHMYFTVVVAGIILLFTVFRRQIGSRSGAIFTHVILGFSRTAIYSVNQMIYCFFNMMLFVPWGMILSFFRKNDSFLRAVIMTTLIGFISSFFIETLQRFTKTGYFEVTDLIMNTLGTILGAFIGFTIITVFKKRDKSNESGQECNK